MRILIATGVYPPESGGPATYTKLLEEKLPPLGIEVRVLPYRAVKQWPKIFRHAAYFFKCLSASRGCKIIYAQDTVSVGLPAALAAWLGGKKFMVRVPGDYAWEQGQQRFGVKELLDEFQIAEYGWKVELLRKIQKFVVRRAQAIVVPSEYMKKIVSHWLVPSSVEGTDAHKISVIYSSIDVPQAQPAQRPDGFYIVSIGRDVPWKNFEGIERVAKREPRWYLFIGRDIPRTEALSQIKAASVFVLNSTYEGLSHLLVEATMLGTPVVATNVGGNPEIIQDGVTGLLVPVNDDDALHAALKNVESNPAEARARATRALERSKEFSIDKAVNKLSALLKTV